MKRALLEFAHDRMGYSVVLIKEFEKKHLKLTSYCITIGWGDYRDLLTFSVSTISNYFLDQEKHYVPILLFFHFFS